MQAAKHCPQCGEYNLYRSRSRNFMEKIIKILVPYKTYRCHNCNWRGWMSKRKMTGERPFLHTLLFYTGIFIITLIVALLLQSVLLK